MGGEGRNLQVAKTRRPGRGREESNSGSISARIRGVWGSFKEHFSRAGPLPSVESYEKTPIPDSPGGEEKYRMNGVRKIAAALGGVRKGSPFWEHDFKSAMERAGIIFRERAGREDHINQEICARMLGLSLSMREMGALDSFAALGGARYLEWAALNSIDEKMGAVSVKVLKAMGAWDSIGRVADSGAGQAKHIAAGMLLEMQ